MAGIRFLTDVTTQEPIQFQNGSGTDAGKIEMDGDDLVISNAVGNVLFGDATGDVYIGDGVNSVDLLFDQNGSIKGEDGGTVTLTLGSSDTTLNVYNPQIGNGMTLTSTMTIGSGGSIDFTPDTGVLLKFDGQTILERRSANGAITFGHDDTTMIVGGDVGATLNANHAAGNERVILGAEGGAIIHSFPNNSTAWADRNTWQFDTDGKLKFGQNGDTNIYRSGSDELRTDDSFVVGSRLYIATRDTNTTSTTALVMNGTEVEQRTLGSNAFNSTTIPTNNNQLTNGAGYLTSVPQPTSGDWWNNGFVKVQTDGVMEVGRYMDWHVSDTGTSDYDFRLFLDSSSRMQFSGNLVVPSNIYHSDDLDTYLKFDANRIRLVAGGTTKFDSNNTYLTSINNGNWSGTDLSIANGGTGASTASAARTNLGLGSAATSASTDFVAVTGDTMTGTLTMSDNIVMSTNYINFNTSDTSPNFIGDRSTTRLNDRSWSTEGGWAYSTFDDSSGDEPSAVTHNANGLLNFNTHSGNYNFQVAMVTSQSEMYLRNQNGGGFNAWRKVITDSDSVSDLGTINNSDWSGTDLSVANGGTGASSASAARTNLGLGSLATLSAVNASTITDNSVGAAELNVSGNGSSGQVLASDGDGTFSWTSAGGTGTVTQVTVGSGLDVSNQTTTPYITLDLSELTDMTASVNTSQDELILLDNGAERRKLFSEIFGSNAYNSTTIPTNNNQLTNGAGYITGINSSDVTTALGYTPYQESTALSATTGSFSGDVTLDDGSGASPNIVFQDDNDVKFRVYNADNNDFFITREGNNGADFVIHADASNYTSSYLTIGNATVSPTTIGNWNTAYGWGNHASAGYLTAHPNISAASSVNNSGRTYIQDITLDSNGHITAITSATETVTNTNTQLSNEQVQDIVGAMVSSNTETNISVTYDDANGKLNFASTDTNTQLSDAQVRSKISGTGLISYNSTTGVISTTANNYSLPAGSSSTRGGFKIGYAENGKNYPVEVSSEKMYVNVPWTDTNTTYNTFAGEEEGLVPNGSSNDATYFLNADGGWTIPPDTNTNTTYTADGNYGLTLSGTTFRLENDRRRNSTSTDIYTGNTHDYTFYDASVGIRWYTAGAEEMRLEDDGDLHVDGDVIAYSTTVSDKRLKDDVETIENASEKVSKLRGVEYTWNEGSRKGQREIGVIAQEVEEVVPEIVHEKKLPFAGDEVYKTVDYEKLVALLIESNKEQQEIISQLEERIIDLENRL